jgi:hypothetical protein
LSSQLGSLDLDKARDLQTIRAAVYDHIKDHERDCPALRYALVSIDQLQRSRFEKTFDAMSKLDGAVVSAEAEKAKLESAKERLLQGFESVDERLRQDDAIKATIEAVSSSSRMQKPEGNSTAIDHGVKNVYMREDQQVRRDRHIILEALDKVLAERSPSTVIAIRHLLQDNIAAIQTATSTEALISQSHLMLTKLAACDNIGRYVQQSHDSAIQAEGFKFFLWIGAKWRYSNAEKERARLEEQADVSKELRAKFAGIEAKIGDYLKGSETLSKKMGDYVKDAPRFALSASSYVASVDKDREAVREAGKVLEVLKKKDATLKVATSTLSRMWRAKKAKKEIGQMMKKKDETPSIATPPESAPKWVARFADYAEGQLFLQVHGFSESTSQAVALLGAYVAKRIADSHGGKMDERRQTNMRTAITLINEFLEAGIRGENCNFSKAISSHQKEIASGRGWTHEFSNICETIRKLPMAIEEGKKDFTREELTIAARKFYDSCLSGDVDADTDTATLRRLEWMGKVTLPGAGDEKSVEKPTPERHHRLGEGSSVA